MKGNFFANYKEFIIYPLEDEKEKEFDPKEYASHFILTFSLYESLLSNWGDAEKYAIEVEKSIQKVLDEFNHSQKGIYHLQLLELEGDKSYFVLSLSCKNKIENEEANDRISYIIDRLISNSFYVGQSWFRLIGNKGRNMRKLFCFSFKEYTI
ncbi:hypothetical protein [Lederbergia citrea]|uniref:Uncharacterized protein n=1 Tax=Lederbergia citrea TaxID=2833581 RepID=A0A942UPM4_9BACI|nr:hypothetical protein [Lederbergia citrea]MBS4177751.1 hypothetical protein [Lederbergia citrea]MBS4204424.1 hypothetical protein [Lederbergia citrea]MBS4223732.1 hypothetical protein [Lederbergia citrea]